DNLLKKTKGKKFILQNTMPQTKMNSFLERFIRRGILHVEGMPMSEEQQQPKKEERPTHDLSGLEKLDLFLHLAERRREAQMGEAPPSPAMPAFVAEASGVLPSVAAEPAVMTAEKEPEVKVTATQE